MSKKHSIASKARWADVPPEERSKRMRKIALKRQAELSPKQKRANALRMVRARKNKNKN